MTATIAVRGAGLASARPDNADLTVTLSALAPTPDDALDDVAERSHELKVILDTCGVAERNRITSGISVHAERERENDRYVFA